MTSPPTSFLLHGVKHHSTNQTISHHVSFDDENMASKDNILNTCGASKVSLEKIIIFSILSGILSLVTSLANLAVFLAFYIESRLRRTSNFFLLSLSAGGIIIGLFSIPLYTYYNLNGLCWHKELGPYACQFWLSIDFTACNMMQLSTLYLIMDRYFALKKPIIYWTWRSDKKITSLIVGSWVIHFTFWFSVFFSRSPERLTCEVHYIDDPIMVLISEGLTFFIPLFLMVFFYIGTYRFIQKESNLHMHVETNNNSSIISKSTNMSRTTAQNAPSSSNEKDGISEKLNTPGTVSEYSNHDNTSGLNPNLEKDEMETIWSNLPSIDTETTPGAINRKQKSLRTINFIFGTFLLVWGPYTIFIVLHAVGININRDVYISVYFLSYANATFNPFLYAYASDRFKTTFIRILQCDWHKR